MDNQITSLDSEYSGVEGRIKRLTIQISYPTIDLLLSLRAGDAFPDPVEMLYLGYRWGWCRNGDVHNSKYWPDGKPGHE